MSVFESVSSFGHEQVSYFYDKYTGLKAIVGIHNTTLGPALGGTRMWAYATEAEALSDVLRLSRGMTYKAAVAGLNLGGGKAVIIGDAKKHKSEAYFRAYGRFIQGLDGRYITAEDVGTTVRDMDWIRQETAHVVGISESRGGSGNPSPVTAMGVFEGLKASVHAQTGSDSLVGKHVAVQGVGSVGYFLVKYLKEAGAQVTVTDISADNLKRVTADFEGIEVVGADEIYGVACDVFAPCALGGVINDETLPQLKAGIVCGSANNILRDEAQHGQALMARGILYAPDYVVNAGGLINVASEREGYNRKRALAQAAAIYDVTRDILKLAREQEISPLQAANTIAEQRIESIAQVQRRYVGHVAPQPTRD